MYTFYFLYSSCGCSSKGLPAIWGLTVSVSTTLKVTLQPTSEVGWQRLGPYNKTRVSLILDYCNPPPPFLTFKPRIVEKQLGIDKVRLVMANRRLLGAVNSRCLNDSFSSIWCKLVGVKPSPSLSWAWLLWAPACFFIPLGISLWIPLGKKKKKVILR